MREGVYVLPLDCPALPQELKSEAMALASDARGTLGHQIHGEAQRRALFGARLRPGQFIVALVDGSIAGMACFKCRGPGPVAPGFVDFVKTLGVAGVRHWVMFNYIQPRIGRDGLYIVGIDVFDGFHRRGVGLALIDELCRIARRSAASTWSKPMCGPATKARTSSIAARALHRRNSRGFPSAG